MAEKDLLEIHQDALTYKFKESLRFIRTEESEYSEEIVLVFKTQFSEDLVSFSLLGESKDKLREGLE